VRECRQLPANRELDGYDGPGPVLFISIIDGRSKFRGSPHPIPMPCLILLQFRRPHFFDVLPLSLSVAGFFIFFSILPLMKFLNWSSWTSDATVDLFWLFCFDLIYINQDPGWRHKVHTHFMGRSLCCWLNYLRFGMHILGAEVMQIYSHFIYLNTTEICLFFTVCQQPCPNPLSKVFPLSLLVLFLDHFNSRSLGSWLNWKQLYPFDWYMNWLKMQWATLISVEF